MIALAFAALLQGGPWSTWPPQPTVGDTVWIERLVAAPAGWRVRPGRFETTDDADPLTDAQLLRHEGGWLVRYGVVVWTTGTVRVPMPALWRLGPGGEADSLEPSTAVLSVRSVLPDSVAQPDPRPALAPQWPPVRRSVPPLLAGAGALLALAAAIWWRRRAPRPLPHPGPPKVHPPVDDRIWLRSGEPRAVAARASAGLRAALARAVPEAPPALSTIEALAVAAQKLPDASYRELAALLTALDQVAFASVHGGAVPQLAEQARTLSKRLAL